MNYILLIPYITAAQDLTRWFSFWFRKVSRIYNISRIQNWFKEVFIFLVLTGDLCSVIFSEKRNKTLFPDSSENSLTCVW